MLKIIMGSERVSQYTDIKFIEFPGTYFDARLKPDWMEDEFVKKVIRQIDNAVIEYGYALKSIKYNTGYSVTDIAGGSKALILMHKIRNRIYLATMGDNCTDLLEEIALSYEQENRDLIIVENYMHWFNFKHIDSIQYLNWDITCHSRIDIEKLIAPRWQEQEKIVYGRGELTEDEILETQRLMENIDNQ